MKKLFLHIFIFTSISVTAQIKTDAGTFTKPSQGTIIMEINFAPNLSGDGIFSLPTFNNDLGVVGVKARKFLSETKAVRAMANLSVSNSGIEGADTQFTVAAGIGIEHHLKGAERLSTYWGYEANLGYVSGLNESFDEFGDAFSSKETKIGLGANLFTGFDYYIIPNVYLGAEVAYGLAITNTKPDGGDGITKFELAPGITPFFRMGWFF